jgi:endonuclease YncB( thermonuclease family)
VRGATYAAALAVLLGLGLFLDVASAGRFSYSGTVSRIVDGDTLDVTLNSGKRERVRVIGIDTPERGACYFDQASQRAATLALGKRVVLLGDATQDTRDRYGRLLAYVDIGGSQDLGARLVREGYAAVYVFRRPFARLASYQAAAASAKTARAGAHTACAAPASAPAPATGCHPNYSKCLPIVSDLDCPDIRAMGKAPVQVLGADPYRLDGDNDGFGCE